MHAILLLALNMQAMEYDGMDQGLQQRLERLQLCLAVAFALELIIKARSLSYNCSAHLHKTRRTRL